MNKQDIVEILTKNLPKDKVTGYYKVAISILDFVSQLDISAIPTHTNFKKPNVLIIHFGADFGFNAQKFYEFKGNIEAKIDSLKGKKTGFNSTSTTLIGFDAQVIDLKAYFVLVSGSELQVTLADNEFKEFVKYIKGLVET